MNQVKRLSKIVIQATELLQYHSKYGYSQKEIVELLKVVGCDISTSFFNQILKKQRGQLKNIQKVRDGLDIILQRELGYIYDERKGQYFIDDPDFQPDPILSNNQSNIASQTDLITVHPAGRLSLREKVDFFKNAKKQVIFFGVRLQQFSNYFEGKKEQDFKMYIEELLQRGVNIDCYMLDFSWEQADFYFKDRASKISREYQSLEKMRLIAEDLKATMSHYNSKEYVGKLKVFTYRHFPQGYYLAVDGDEDRAKMQFAPYLFGLPRSESPVQEIYKREQPELFEKYWESLVYLIENVTPLDR